MPPVYVMIKPASGLCNLRCEYCFYHDEMQNRANESFGIMSEAVLEAIIQKALSYADGMCSISFQGGEPTLAGLPFFQLVVELQKKHNKKGIPIHNAIQTNGIGINQDFAKFLARNRFLTGLSLDGVKITHDTYRKDMKGEETFTRVIETARLFTQNKVEFNILTVINSKTAAQIERIYRFYQRSGFRFLQFIACLDPIGTTPGARDYSLTPELYGEFLCTLFDLWYEDLQLGRQPYIRSFENYVAILCGYEPESCDMKGFCGMQYVAEADGSVYPCDFYMMDDYRLGNLMDDDFSKLDKRRYELGFIQKSEVLPSDCSRCKWARLCRGGCMRNRFTLDSETYNYFCPSYQQFFAYTEDRLNKIASDIQRSKNSFLPKQ